MPALTQSTQMADKGAASKLALSITKVMNTTFRMAASPFRKC
jgi:hypothetical protein